jgi:hypothetical protein
MTTPLLNRQISLLTYLTSGNAVFCNEAHTALPIELKGIDPALLHLEARFSFEKRMHKIATIFPKTLHILESRRNEIFRGFSDACPPAHIGRLENAKQFFEFLSNFWREAGPPYWRDVAACELACAEILRDASNAQIDTRANDAAATGFDSIRRSPNLVLLRCEYDVRPIFEGDLTHTPEQRDTPVAIVKSLGRRLPSMFSIAPAIFDLLDGLDEWADTRSLDAETKNFILELAERGLVEVRR